MKRLGYPLKSLMVLGLAACGGGGGGSDAPANVPTISSGILNIEIPSEADRAGLSPEINQLIDDIQFANEEGTAITPGLDITFDGVATYDGVFGIAVDDDYGTIVGGTLSATFTLADSDMDVEFTPVEVDTIAPVTVSGGFGALDMPVSAGLYSGIATGTLTVSDGEISEPVSVFAEIDGAIIAEGTFGTLGGRLTNSDETYDTFGGFFAANIDLPPPN